MSIFKDTPLSISVYIFSSFKT